MHIVKMMNVKNYAHYTWGNKMIDWEKRKEKLFKEYKIPYRFINEIIEQEKEIIREFIAEFFEKNDEAIIHRFNLIVYERINKLLLECKIKKIWYFIMYLIDLKNTDILNLD